MPPTLALGARKWRALDRKPPDDETLRRWLREDFYESPAGLARLAYERGDCVLQVSLDVSPAESLVVPTVETSLRPRETDDATEILQAVCNEGWELLGGSFVFETTRVDVHGRLLTGYDGVVHGVTVGYYLFRRREENRRRLVDPWAAHDVKPQ